MSDTHKTKWWIIVAALAVACVVAGLGLMSWRENVTKANEQRRNVEQLLAEGRGAEALALIQQRNRAVKKQSEKVRQQWLVLEAAALAQTGDGPRLLLLYTHEPQAFKDQEPASIQVGRALLRTTDFEGFDKLRASWRGREKTEGSWFDLDVDALLQRGKREEAIQLLNSRSFAGAADCGRLTRLALAHLPGDTKSAWNYLERAAKLDPRNSEVRLHRGRMLEAAGKIQPAHIEYYAAYAANTNNAYFLDQLAEFHRRNGNYEQAVLTWGSGLTNANATDVMWLRAWFWTRVARAAQFNWTKTEPPAGTLTPFVRYLVHLPAGTFWDESAFRKLSMATFYEENVQEAFWLRLLAALKGGQEDEAIKLIESNRFRPNSWNLDLESTVLRVLNYRKTGKIAFPAGVTIPLNQAPPNTRHQIFELIDAQTKNPDQKLPADTERLLRGQNAFAAIFVASGWIEAGLQLPHEEIIPDGHPEWVSFAFTQGIRFSRGIDPALEYAAKQKQSPKLQLLTAEILLSGQRYGDAIIKLTPLATNDTDAGFSAARTIVETYSRFKQYDEARAALEAQPRLRQSVTGKELLARMAYQQGDAVTANKIFASIESESDEAKDYLAKQAYDQKNWARARQLTEALIQNHPDRSQYRAKLDAIDKAEAESGRRSN